MRSPPSDQASSAGEASSTRLRVLTWNVGEVYWPWQGNQLKDRDVDLVVRALAELDPDVVLLQELEHEGQLARLCSDGRYAGAVPSSCGYDRQVALLVKAERAPRFREHVLQPTRRGVMEASFRAAPGVEARAFSLHFDVFRAERRLEQARAAMALVGDPGQLTVAGGDFNYDPVASARLHRVADAGTEAAFCAVLDDVAPEVGPTLVGLLRVDRLFAGGRALAAAAARTTRHRLPLGDHAPIVCDLTLRPAAKSTTRGD